MSKIRRMFPGGNTAQGFYSFHDNIIGPHRNMLYILKGMPGGGKSSLMKEIGKRALDEGFSVEYHHCPSDAESIDGIVIEELQVAIVDGTAPHVMDPTYPGLTDRLIDLGQFIDSEKLKDSREEIIEAKGNNKIAYRKAFAYFKSARVIYEEILANNKSGVEIKGLNLETRNLMEKIFIEKPKNNEGVERHMFANANTPSGYVDHTETILNGISNIYYVQGEIGRGKNYIIEKIIEASKLSGYSIEIYHDSTIVDEIETLIIKDIDTCISSNKKAKDLCVEKVELDKHFNRHIKNIEDYNTYEFLMEKGINNLAKAKKNHEILEEIYNPTIDYSGIDRIREDIWEEIFNFSKSLG